MILVPHVHEAVSALVACYAPKKQIDCDHDRYHDAVTHPHFTHNSQVMVYGHVSRVLVTAQA
jgi:hypothetical protein